MTVINGIEILDIDYKPNDIKYAIKNNEPIEEKLNVDNLKLKNTLLEKELELERMKNTLVRHKISFPFTPQTNHNLTNDITNKKSFFINLNSSESPRRRKDSKTFIEKFFNNL